MGTGSVGVGSREDSAAGGSAPCDVFGGAGGTVWQPDNSNKMKIKPDKRRMMGYQSERDGSAAPPIVADQVFLSSRSVAGESAKPPTQ